MQGSSHSDENIFQPSLVKTQISNVTLASIFQWHFASSTMTSVGKATSICLENSFRNPKLSQPLCWFYLEDTKQLGLGSPFSTCLFSLPGTGCLFIKVSSKFIFVPMLSDILFLSFLKKKYFPAFQSNKYCCKTSKHY